jgi:hypothetical protein
LLQVTAQFGSKSLGGTDGVLMLASDERESAACRHALCSGLLCW